MGHLHGTYISHCTLANHIQGLSQPLEFTGVLQWVHFIYIQKMQFPYCNLNALSKDSLHSTNKWEDTEIEYRRLQFLSLQSIARKYHKDTDESNIQPLKEKNPHFRNTIGSSDSVHAKLRRMPVGSFSFLALFTYKPLFGLCANWINIFNKWNLRAWISWGHGNESS